MQAGTTTEEAQVETKEEKRRRQKREWYAKFYAAKKPEEQERCRLTMRRVRSGEAPAERETYDPEEYVEEFKFLTQSGRLAADIIAASAPGIKWFNEHVLPRVSRSICASCNTPFDPRHAGSLTRCSKTCGTN